MNGKYIPVGFEEVSVIEQKLLNVKLTDCSNGVKKGDNSGLDCFSFNPECDSNSSNLSKLFVDGISSDNFSQFCELFSRVLYSRSQYGVLNGPREDHVTDTSRDFDKVEEDGNFGYTDQEMDRVYWESLEWFANVLDELNRFESLGFGIVFLVNSLRVFLEKSKWVERSGLSENVEKLKKWIDFVNVFRDANNSIYTTYALLERMEARLNYIKYKSMKILQMKLNNKMKFISGGVSVTSQVTNNFDQFDTTPINTPSSTSTNISDRAEMDLLHEIWDSKFEIHRVVVFNKFRQYLVGIIDQLKGIYPRFNYYQLVQFILYTKVPNTEDGDLLDYGNRDGGTSTECEENDDNLGDCYDLEDSEDILEYLNRYYAERNMNEEKADSYVSRITDLNKRLIPKFVKIISKLPIYYEAYLNALICKNIQDGLFQLISSESHSNYKEAFKDTPRDPIKDKDSVKGGKEPYRDESSDYRNWLHKVGVVKLLSKTQLEVVDLVRCSFGGSRKAVLFTQGALRDLVNNPNTHTHHKELYKDFKDPYKDLYRDNVLIKGEGTDSKNDKEDDDFLKSIYYCNSNLGEVASEEIDKVIIQQLPPFNWLPKLVKYQLSLQSRKTNYNYGVNQDLDYYSLEGNGVVEGNGLEYVEYIKLEEKIWMNRLSMFNRINERNIRNLLLKRNNNNVEPIKYESSNMLLRYNIPFVVLLDYNNYIPIKYIYNENNSNDNSSGTGKDVDDKDWLIRLFNSNNNKVFKNNCIDIEIERDHFPGFTLFNNLKLNCFILPIHEGNFRSQESFVNFSKIVENRIDLMYPSYLEQVNQVMMGREGDSRVFPVENGFNGKYGDYFVTYHTNLAVPTKEKMLINFVFHLVCCDTSLDDDVNPIEYAEDTEVILKHIQKIQPILNGLANILKMCNQFNIHTVHMPASLKCCYKINQYNNSVILTEFQNQGKGYGHLSSQIGGGSNLNTNDLVLECNNDYVRCLAVVSHLASLLNKNKYSISNFNLIFPQHLKQTLLSKTAANIFTSRVNTF